MRPASPPTKCFVRNDNGGKKDDDDDGDDDDDDGHAAAAEGGDDGVTVSERCVRPPSKGPS